MAPDPSTPSPATDAVAGPAPAAAARSSSDAHLSIAIIRARYNPYGGAERFVQRALAALSGGPIALTVIARRWRRDPRDGEASQTGVRWQRIDPFFLGSLWRDASFSRAVRAHLARTSYSLVQSHERIPGVPVYRAGDGVHAEYLAQRARVLSVWMRGWMRISPYHRWLLRTERQMFEHPGLRAVICNSMMVRDEILARFRIAPERLRVIRNGVDLRRFAPPTSEQRQAARFELGLTSTEPIFAFVGSGFERKGLEGALRALTDPVLPPDLRLIVAGTDKHLARYRRRADQLGVLGRVVFLGGVGNVLPVLHAADGFVQPTLYDPFPNAVLEALACGLPTVTSPKSGAAEVITPGVNGFAPDACDVPAIARAMAAILRAPSRAAMREAARASVSNLSAAALGDELLAFYRELTAVAPAHPLRAESTDLV
ncbi:MAG: glycosyltransferase family 4 protein [Burkholderiaceae bacterium]